MYGGQSNVGGKVETRYRPVQPDVYLFNILTHEFNLVEPLKYNRLLQSRRNHCAASFSKFMLIYGGLNTVMDFLDDV